MQGTVKFFNEAKGFGFIKPSNSTEESKRPGGIRSRAWQKRLECREREAN